MTIGSSMSATNSHHKVSFFVAWTQRRFMWSPTSSKPPEVQGLDVISCLDFDTKSRKTGLNLKCVVRGRHGEKVLENKLHVEGWRQAVQFRAAMWRPWSLCRIGISGPWPACLAKEG